MKFTIEIDDDNLFDMINEGASYNDKSVDRAKFNELVKQTAFQEAVGATIEALVHEDLSYMDDFEWIYNDTAKFDMFVPFAADVADESIERLFVPFNANEIAVEERSSGYWVTDGDGLVEGPFDDYETAVKFVQEKK